MYHVIRDGIRDVWLGRNWTIYKGRVYKRTGQSLRDAINTSMRFHLVDKCTPIERKAVYIAYGPQLRAMGVIK